MNTQLDQYLKSINDKNLKLNSKNHSSLLKYFDKTSRNFFQILLNQYIRMISNILFEGYITGTFICSYIYSYKENDKNIKMNNNIENIENTFRNIYFLPLPYISNSNVFEKLKRFILVSFILLYYIYYIINYKDHNDNENNNKNKIFNLKSNVSVVLFHVCINIFSLIFIIGIYLSFTIYRCMFSLNDLNESFECILHFLKTCQLHHMGRRMSLPKLAPVSRLECSLYERHSLSERMNFISMKEYRLGLSTTLQRLENDVKEISSSSSSSSSSSCSKSKIKNDYISSTSSTSSQLLLYELERSYSTIQETVIQNVLFPLVDKVNSLISYRRRCPVIEIVRDYNIVTDVNQMLSMCLEGLQIILKRMKNFYRLEKEKKKEVEAEAEWITAATGTNITHLKRHAETFYHRLCQIEELLQHQYQNRDEYKGGDNESNIHVAIDKVLELNEANVGLQVEMQEWQTELDTILLHCIQPKGEEKKENKEKKEENGVQVSDNGNGNVSIDTVHHESDVLTSTSTKLPTNIEEEEEDDVDDIVDVYTAMVADNVHTSGNMDETNKNGESVLKEKDLLLQTKINAMSLKELREIIQTRPTKRERIKTLGEIKSDTIETDIVGISTGNKIEIESIDYQDITRKATTMSRPLSLICMDELKTQMELLHTSGNQEEEFSYDEDLIE